MATQLNEILKLSLSERIIWAQTIWNSIALENDSEEILKVSPEHKKILDKELLLLKKNTSAGSSWTDVKARIKKRK